MQKVYKDNLKTVLLAVIIVLVVGLTAFYVASQFLKPKGSTIPETEEYKAKAQYPNENITLTYWRTVDGTAVFDPILTEWKKQHPNVTIQITNFPLAEYDKRLSEAAKAGTLPDLMMMRADWLPRYQNNLKPAPNTIFSVDAYKNTFAPITAQDLIKNNQVYAVSYGIPTLGLFYNTQAWEAVGLKDTPRSWQDLLDANAKLSQKQGQDLYKSGIALGTANITSANAIITLLMMQNGAKMTDQPPTKATFDQPGADNYPSSAKALSFYTSFAQPSKSSYSWSDALGNSTQAFEQGKTAMMVQYPFAYLDVKAQAPNLNFKMAKIPQVNSGSPINYSEYWAESVATTSKYPDIAWDFYNFMTTKKIMNQYSVPTMKPASRLDLAKEQEQDTLLGPFAAQVPSAQGYYKGNNTASDAAMLEMINTALSGYDPLIAVRTANGKVTQSIQQFPY